MSKSKGEQIQSKGPIPYKLQGNQLGVGGIPGTACQKINYSLQLPISTDLFLLKSLACPEHAVSEAIDGGLYGSPTSLHGSTKILVNHTTSAEDVPAVIEIDRGLRI